ncbi:MAG: tRNA dimethylallyltransferase [Frankiales bacterium]|nr:tRNA dimethylallyltransferase [Frankiales bacterium]
MTTDLLLAVVGPTAAGKSSLALDLALALDGEIVNADSMQLYRGLDIGTAKLPPAERRGVLHHLLDVWDVTETASVAEYQRMARLVVDDVLSRSRRPVLVGGSGLYLRSVLDDLTFPGTDPTVRARLEDELATVGAATLHARLAGADPAAAAAILPGNGRRVVRALEVIETTGQPFTATLPDYRYLRPALQIGIDVPLPELDRRIEHRVDAMFASGLVVEVRGLLEKGLKDGRTASRALGYAQAAAMLDGSMSESDARADTVRATRRFARRQRSWFRRDPRVVWLRAGPTLTDEALTLIRRTIDS